MNEKKAKQLRRLARAQCAEQGVPEQTAYKVIPRTVKFEGALFSHVNTSGDTMARRDRNHDKAKAARYGVSVNWVLSELFGDVRIQRAQIVLGPCLRGITQRAKRALR
jgi:hypothetical protein